MSDTVGPRGSEYAALLGIAAAWAVLPSVDWLDSGSLTSAAWHLGVAHPPGEAAWIVLARVAMLVPLGDIHFRANVLSAVALVACALPLLALVKLLSGGRVARGAAPWAVAVALLSPIAWPQGVRAEVYAPTALLLLTTLWAALSGGRRGSLLAGFLVGLGAGLHPLLVAAALPALAAARLLRGPGGFADLPAAVVAGLAGFGVQALLPLRALRRPALAWGVPDDPGALVDVLLARTFARNFGPGGGGLGNLETVLSVWTVAGLPLLVGLAVVELVARRGELHKHRTWLAVAVSLPLWLLGNAATILPQNKAFGSNPDLQGYLLIGLVAVAAPAALAWTCPGSELVARLARLVAYSGGALVAMMGLASHRGDSFLARRFAAAQAYGAPTGAEVLTAGNDPAFLWTALQRVEDRRPDLLMLHRPLLGHAHDLLRVGPALRERRALQLGPALRDTPVEVAVAAGRPLLLELREGDSAAASRAGWALQRHGLLVRLQPEPADEPAALARLRAGVLAEMEADGADVEARLVAAYLRELAGDSGP